MHLNSDVSRNLTFATSGDLVKLATVHSASARSGMHSELNFTNIFSSTYDNYLMLEQGYITL